MEKYDLIVIGTGPAGEKAAVKAAYFGYRVAIIEKQKKVGGAMVITGTLPSKTLKETSLYFSGKYEKGLYGIDRTLTREASIEDFMYRKNIVTETAEAAIHENLLIHNVDIYRGVGSFKDTHTIEITSDDEATTIRGEHIIIATGSYPYHPPGIPFDGKRVHDSDTILNISRFPKSLCIVGAGVIGCEYTTIFSTSGTKIYLVNNQFQILPFVDHEVSLELIEELKNTGVSIHFNTFVKEIVVPESDEDLLQITLDSGQKIEVDMFLFAAGRNGTIHYLNLEAAGVKVGDRETIEIDETYRTNVKNIYAVGDVIGFPALASTSMDQGRVAVAHIFQTKDLENLPSFFPYGIYTDPEISMVGVTEEEAVKQGIDYCVGRARYSDMPRGKIMGVKSGFLKMIFNRKTKRIIGIHIIGSLATELIHYGLGLVEDQKSLYDVIGTVFNYPTLHDLYKYAAYDGMSVLTGHKVKA